MADAAAPGLAEGGFDVVLGRHVLWALLLQHWREVEVVVLSSPALRGGPIEDERYLVVSRR